MNRERRYSRRSLFALAVAGATISVVGCGSTKSNALTGRTPGSTPQVGALNGTPGGTVRPVVSTSPSAAAQQFITPQNPAWSYYAGPWAQEDNPGWPAPRMAPVFSPQRPGGICRRFAIATDSPTAMLLVRSIGQTLRVAVGGDVQQLGPYPADGSRQTPLLYSGHSGVTQIDIWSAYQGDNDGLYLAAGARVLRPEPDLGQRKKLLGIGHSYMEGTGATAAGWTSALPLVADTLGWQPINQGVGSTDVNSDGVKPLGSSGLARLQSDVIDLKPNAVLVEYGRNAIGPPNTPASYQQDCTTFLRRLRSGLPSVPVFWSGSSAGRSLTDAQLVPWNAAIKVACAAVPGCTFIDAKGLDTATGISQDGTHPNDAGYRFLADRYLAVMKPLLK